MNRPREGRVGEEQKWCKSATFPYNACSPCTSTTLLHFYCKASKIGRICRPPLTLVLTADVPDGE